MIDKEAFLDAIARAAAGTRDVSGKTPLDNFIEDLREAKPSLQEGELVQAVSAIFPSLIERGPSFARLGREIIRRLKLRDSNLAASLKQLLTQAPARTDLELRRWLSLALMDLSFPRTVASLQSDSELRRQYIGDWLTLVAANKSFSAVQKAFLGAIGENLVSVKQLALKSEVIRRNFGDHLSEFSESVALALQNADDRNSYRTLIRQMYGIDVGDESPRKPKLSDWLQQTTFELLEKVGGESVQRELKRAA